MIPIIVLLASVGAACTPEVERAVANRLPKGSGAWLVRCADAGQLDITRLEQDGTARARMVDLYEVTEALRVEVAVLAAQVLELPPASEQEPAPKEKSPRNERRESPNASQAGPTAASPVVNVVVVPSATAAEALLRSDVHGYAALRSQWFPSHGTWLIGPGGGVEWRRLRLSLEVMGSQRETSLLAVRVLASQVEASALVGCITESPLQLCARAAGALGAALVSGSAESDAVRQRDRFAPLLTAAGDLAAARRFTGWAAGLAFRVGIGVGPAAVVDRRVEATWAGLHLGLSVFVVGQ